MICQSCGGVVGRDCFNPEECMSILRAQASYGEQASQSVRSIADVNESLRGELVKLIEEIRYWSYCTRMGCIQTCPENLPKLAAFMHSLGIEP